MSEGKLMAAKLAEHKQRRKVELLRQRLYGQPDPSGSPELLEQLKAAEKRLRELSAQRLAEEPATGKGVLLDTGEEGEKPGGIMLGADTTGVDAQVLLRQSHVPTGIVHLLHAERTPLVTFRVQYTGRVYVRLRLKSFVEGYSAQAVDTVELQRDGSAEIHQLPTFFPGPLETVTELTRATLNIQIDDLDGKTEQQSTFPIWLLARTSAYLGIEDPATGEWVDLTAYLGAWVTPNAEGVMELLRAAADKHPEKQIVGYQVDAQGIEEQVKAAYDALKEQGITYVNSVLAFGATRGEYIQRVRLPRESLEKRSANCIDGTVLMASVLEAASLNPAIVLIPGHAFLAWETQDGSGEWDYLETTMIGQYEFDAAHQSGQATAKDQMAMAEWLNDDSYFQRLSLPELRAKYGITPME